MVAAKSDVGVTCRMGAWKLQFGALMPGSSTWLGMRAPPEESMMAASLLGTDLQTLCSDDIANGLGDSH